MEISKTMKILSFLSFVTILLTFHSSVKSQNPVPDKQAADAVFELRKKVEAQEQQFAELKELIKKQTEIIETQQKQINQLIAKSDSANADKLAGAPAANNASIAVNRTAAVTSAPDASPTPAVESGFGKIRFDGLLQGWYSAGSKTQNTLRIRRAEMKFSGQINPEVRWTIMIDPAKSLSLNQTTKVIDGVPVVTGVSINQSSRVLQDAFISLGYIKNVNIDIGQFKIPLSLEGPQSSAALDTVERALFMSDRSRGGGLGDIRDTGIQFSGPLGKSINYQIGVFNGTGENQNISDTNQDKAVIGRFVFRPSFIKGLQIGASGALSNSNRTTNPRRDRAGGELLYTTGRFKFKAEVMGGVDGELHRLGYYAHVGYKITPKFEAIFRIDEFDPDRRGETNSKDVSERDYISGFNYYVTENHFKFQFNYIRKTFNNGIQASRNLFLANLQTSW